MSFKETAFYIETSCNLKENPKPKIAIVLGSGLSEIADGITQSPKACRIPYKQIPGFPVSTVDGHKGELIYGSLKSNIPVIVLSGRFHKYEGYDAKKTIFPIRALKYLGIETIILTNMSGAMGDGFCAGDLMVITDHINFTGDNPLIGPNIDDLGPRFLDMSQSYDKDLIQYAINAAKEHHITMHQGIYLAVSGPSYETPAEIQMFKSFGASAIGMSTVFETIAARHAGMKVLGISCFSNLAAGLSNEKISHEEVFLMGQRMSSNLKIIIEEVVKNISNI